MAAVTGTLLHLLCKPYSFRNRSVAETKEWKYTLQWKQMVKHNFISSPRNSYEIKGQNHSIVMYILLVH